MSVDIYILGTSHPLQCGSSELPERCISLYESEIKRVLKKFKIKRISEEMSEDGRKHHKIANTVAQNIAKEMNIAYQEVDLSQDDRTNFSLDDSTLFQVMSTFGIENGAHLRSGFDDLVDGIRERMWVAKILSNNEWPVLFICGAEHSVSIRKLFRGMGFSSKVEHIDYEP